MSDITTLETGKAANHGLFCDGAVCCPTIAELGILGALLSQVLCQSKARQLTALLLPNKLGNRGDFAYIFRANLAIV